MDNIKIYTTYFSKVKALPDGIIPISICGKAPDWWNGLQYKKLAPKWAFFKAWKENKDNDFYVEHFYDEVLTPLNPDTIIEELRTLSCGKDVALVCYEKPSDFCHRHLVANWLTSNTNIEVTEYGCTPQLF